MLGFGLYGNFVGAFTGNSWRQVQQAATSLGFASLVELMLPMFILMPTPQVARCRNTISDDLGCTGGQQTTSHGPLCRFRPAARLCRWPPRAPSLGELEVLGLQVGTSRPQAGNRNAAARDER